MPASPAAAMMISASRTAMQRAVQQRQQDRGNSQNQKQAGQQLRGAVPLNISRMVAMAPHGGTRDTLEGAGGRWHRDGRRQRAEYRHHRVPAEPQQQRPPAPDRVRQLTDDQLSQAEASQRISSRSPDDGRLKRCHCSHATRDPLG
jgi:hypothetical protein